MGFIYGLTVVLFIFAGIIIQCEHAEGVRSGESSNRGQDALTTDTKEGDLLLLTKQLNEMTLSKDFIEEIIEAIKTGEVPTIEMVVSTILQKCIISIKPVKTFGGVHANYKNGDLFLRFGDPEDLKKIFNKFGHQIKKIQFDNRPEKYIEQRNVKHDAKRSEIQKNIVNLIKGCAENLEELRIKTEDDEGFWSAISEGGTKFLKMENLQIIGESTQKKLNLNIIFPNLRSCTLDGDITDVDFLENVKNLNEFTLLNTNSISGKKLENIIKKHKAIEKIAIELKNTNTMHFIASHLKELKTLHVVVPDRNYLLKKEDKPVTELSQVTQFSLTIGEVRKIFEIKKFSIYMPKLEWLSVCFCDYFDNQIIDFINHYKTIKIVEFYGMSYKGIEYVAQLKHIEEFTTNIHGYNFESLREMFKNVDKNTKLKTLRLVCKSYLYDDLKDELEKNAPITWKLTDNYKTGKTLKYLELRREPCTMPMQVWQLNHNFVDILESNY